MGTSWAGVRRGAPVFFCRFLLLPSRSRPLQRFNRLAERRSAMAFFFFFRVAPYVQFEEPKRVLVISVYSGLFCSCLWLRETLKTNKTTSASVDLFFLFFLSSFTREARPQHFILAAPEVSDRPSLLMWLFTDGAECQPSSPCCFSIRAVCSPPPFFFLSIQHFLMLKKIFLSGHQWINGALFTCQRLPLPGSLHHKGTLNSSLTECFSPGGPLGWSLGSVGLWVHG